MIGTETDEANVRPCVLDITSTSYRELAWVYGLFFPLSTGTCMCFFFSMYFKLSPRAYLCLPWKADKFPHLRVTQSHPRSTSDLHNFAIQQYK